MCRFRSWILVANHFSRRKILKPLGPENRNFTDRLKALNECTIQLSILCYTRVGAIFSLITLPTLSVKENTVGENLQAERLTFCEKLEIEIDPYVS